MVDIAANNVNAGHWGLLVGNVVAARPPKPRAACGGEAKMRRGACVGEQ